MLPKYCRYFVFNSWKIKVTVIFQLLIQTNRMLAIFGLNPFLIDYTYLKVNVLFIHPFWFENKIALSSLNKNRCRATNFRFLIYWIMVKPPLFTPLFALLYIFVYIIFCWQVGVGVLIFIEMLSSTFSQQMVHAPAAPSKGLGETSKSRVTDDDIERQLAALKDL